MYLVLIIGKGRLHNILLTVFFRNTSYQRKSHKEIVPTKTADYEVSSVLVDQQQI